MPSRDIGKNPIKIPLVPVKRRTDAFQMDVESAEKVFISTLLHDELHVGDVGTSDAEYVTIRTKVPHGIRKSGTTVVLENFGPSSGTRIVYVEDDRTLTMKRLPGEPEQPVPSRNARLYVPYTSTTGIVMYTQGEEGRPEKKSRQCAKREAYDQCEKMPNLKERTYTMLPQKCVNRIEGGRCKVDSQCRKEFRKKGYKTYARAKCEDENLDPVRGRQGTCALYETVSCGFARHFAGVGPSDAGMSHATRSLASTASLIASDAECLSSTCVIPGSGDIINEGGMDFCNRSKSNCEACQREGSAAKGRRTNRALSKGDSVQECAEACAKDVECQFFLFDKANGACYSESTVSKECLEGMTRREGVDMYELVLAEKDVGCSRYGSTCCPEAHVRAKGDANVKCAFQEPQGDGSYRLSLVNPGDPLSTMCEVSAVETRRTNAELELAARKEEREFSDMQDKNSHIRMQMAKNESMREELDGECCDADGENCGCPYISDFPVYYQAYEHTDTDAVPTVARLTFPIPGCDAWNDLEEEIRRGNFNGATDVRQALRDGQVSEDDADAYLASHSKSVYHGSYRIACEAGWQTRSCSAYSKNPMELAACRSGAYLKSVGAPKDYAKDRRIKLADAEARKYLEGMGEVCNPKQEVGAPGFCDGVCSEESKRCMQCSHDEACRGTYGDDFVCAPYVDVGREILYDGNLSSDKHLRHSFLFKTCQRKDRRDADMAFLQDTAFANRQRLEEQRMRAASSRALWTTVATLIAISIAGIAMMRLRR